MERGTGVATSGKGGNLLEEDLDDFLALGEVLHADSLVGQMGRVRSLAKGEVDGRGVHGLLEETGDGNGSSFSGVEGLHSPHLFQSLFCCLEQLVARISDPPVSRVQLPHHDLVSRLHLFMLLWFFIC